jgi:peptide/nickel transport system substrate-binding protein
MLIGIAGCVKTTPTSPSSAPIAQGTPEQGNAPSTEAPIATDNQSGGTLKIGVSQEVIHPLLSFTLTGAPIDYFSSWPVYESLFRPNEKGSVDPWLLESYEADPASKTYTFHIREGITFSDGSPLNAESCKWNLDHYLEVGAKVAALLPTVQSVDIVDEYTVRLNLSEWSSIIPYVFSRECGYMYSMEYYLKNGDEACQNVPVGTGPFVLDNWEKDVKRTYVKRNDYWGGEVKLDSVEYIIYKDPLVAAAALESGELDAYLGMSADNAQVLAGKGLNVGTCSVKSHTYMLCFNSLNESKNDPTGDVRVRQAISYAIDTDALVKSVWGDFANTREQFGVGEYFFSKDVKGYSYDVQKAKDLLKEAGYENGFTIDLKTEDNPPKVKAVTIIQQYLHEVGIEANIVLLSGADANAAEAGWGDGMWLHSSSVYVSVPMQMASMFRKDLTGHVLGLTNMLRPDDLDAALKLSVAASSPEEELNAIGEANRLITDEYCIIYNLAEVPTIFITRPEVMDSDIGTIFYSIASLDKAWIKK